MPIGPFKDWDDCVNSMRGKVDDPEAYCGALERDSSSMADMWVVADVVFDTDNEAREAERLAREGKLAGVSVDLGNVTSEIEILATDEDGFPTDWLETLTQGEILGATQVAMPAFADARIVEEDGSLVAYLAPEGLKTSDRRGITPHALDWRENAPLMFNDTSDGHEGAVHVGNLVNFRRVGELALVASTNPGLTGITRPFVQDGKLVGHGAGWGTCHLSLLEQRGVCVTPPEGSEAQTVNVYRHPRGDIHAPTVASVGMDEASRWYDAHCELVGRVGVGEDDFGIWVAGDTTLPDGDYYLSGDWRTVDGRLELNSFLVVENPAYPLALTASDEQVALVAAGIVTETKQDLTEMRLARLEAALFTPQPAPELVEYFEAEALVEAFQ